MFREGQYLEVIKTPDGCVATAIVTVKEKTVEYKNKAMKTNKWLELQDWACLYGIIRKAVIRNYEDRSNGKTEYSERRKISRQLDVTYKFEDAESPDDRTSMPTIRVTVRPVRKSASDLASSSSKEVLNELEKYGKKRDTSSQKSKTSRKSSEISLYSENYSLEEYVPPALPNSTKASAGLKYVPSRKSMLLRMRCATDENKYTPTSGNGQIPTTENDSHTEVSYIPNPIQSLKKVVHETYDPCAATVLSPDLSKAYVPSSKGSRAAIEEYEPDFASTTMKFDDNYVPSTTNAKVAKEESKKRSRKSLDQKKNKKTSSSRSAVLDNSKREL